MLVSLCGSKSNIVTNELRPCGEQLSKHVIGCPTFLLYTSNDVTDISGGRNTLEGLRLAVFVVRFSQSQQWIPSGSIMRVSRVIFRSVKVSIDESQGMKVSGSLSGYFREAFS
jgi:hypothetical protein